MKKVLLFFFLIMAIPSLRAQVTDSTALLIIDIQDFYFPGGSLPLVNPGEAAQKAAELLKYCREKGVLVVHVGHLAKSGAEFHELVKPAGTEKVFMKKEVNAFLNTGLDEYLRLNKISNLIICGMQTHMCLEGAVRAGHDLGYRCVVAADACATRDLTYGEATVKAADVHASTLATLKSYCKVQTVKEITGGL